MKRRFEFEIAADYVKLGILFRNSWRTRGFAGLNLRNSEFSSIDVWFNEFSNESDRLNQLF